MCHQIQGLRRLTGHVVAAMLYTVIAALAALGCADHHEARTGGEERAEDPDMMFKRIGVIRSPYTPEKGAPRQGALAPGVESLIVIDPEYEAGLKDIETFSHVIVLYVFDRSSGWNPTVQTPWEKKRHGVFATRSPRRPNPIGMTVVRLAKRSGATLHVLGLDAFDGTLVLDLKPFVPRFDGVEDASHGWLGDWH